MSFSADQWAVILGGSSGFGLATAKRLGALGMSVCAVHRDRRAMLAKIEPEFEKIRAGGTRLITINTDALDAEKRREVLDELAPVMGAGRVRVLLHSVAFGNLKLLVAEAKTARRNAAAELAGRLHVDAGELQKAIDELFVAGHSQALGLASAPEYSDKHFLDEEDFSRTIHAMGTSLLGWVQELFARGLFASDARVFGLTSEGNEVAWKGYAAVAAAKVSLESLARSIAVEFAPYGIRCNVIQAGITHTPAQDAIPGSGHMRAQALSRNPMGRLTTPEDVANVIGLLASDEAGWINGEVIRVDGGEHISGSVVVSEAEAEAGKPVALVTGGGTGIGAACCRALASEGFRVGVHYRSSEDKARALAESLGDAFAIRADLAVPEEVEALVAELKDAAGRVDVLVNNAGFNVNAPMLAMKLDDYDAVAAMNRGTWLLTKGILRRFMLRKKSGRIINISSIVGSTGNPGQIPYTMMKAGLDAFAKSLAQELAGRDILVNAVAPGFIDTDMTDELPDDLKAAILMRIPQQRMGKPEEVADVVAFLATRGSYVNGCVIHVNGGMFGG